MPRTWIVIPVAGSLATPLLLATTDPSESSWIAGRADGFIDLATAAMASPWAWLYLLIAFASGVVARRRLTGGLAVVGLSLVAVFLLGPQNPVLPWLGLTFERLLIASPADNADLAYNNLAIRMGDPAQAAYALGFMFGVPCLLALVAHLRGRRFAATVGLGDGPTPFQILVDAKARPVGLTPSSHRILALSVLATLVTTVLVWLAAGAVWLALTRGDVPRGAAIVRFGTIADPGRAALLGGWYPAAFWAAPLLGFAAAFYLMFRARMLHEQDWNAVVVPAMVGYWLFMFVGMIAVLVVPAGVLLFLSGFTVFAAVLMPFGLWPIPEQAGDRHVEHRRAKRPRGRRRRRKEAEQKRKQQQVWLERQRAQERQREADRLLQALLAAQQKPPPEPKRRSRVEAGGVSLASPPVVGTTLAAHPTDICAGCLLDDGALAVLETSGVLCVYRHGQEVQRIATGAGPAAQLRACPGRAELYVIDRDTIHIVEPGSGTTRTVTLPPDGVIEASAVSSQGACVIARADGATTTRFLAVFPGPGTTADLGTSDRKVSALAFSDDGRFVAAGGELAGIDVIDLATRQHHRVATKIADVVGLAAAGSGRWAVAGESGVELVDERLADASRQAAAKRKVVAFAAARDGSAVAVGSTRGKLQLLAGLDWKSVLDEQVHAKQVVDLAFDDDGAVISFGADGTARRVRP